MGCNLLMYGVRSSDTRDVQTSPHETRPMPAQSSLASHRPANNLAAVFPHVRTHSGTPSRNAPRKAFLGHPPSPPGWRCASSKLGQDGLTGSRLALVQQKPPTAPEGPAARPAFHALPDFAWPKSSPSTQSLSRNARHTSGLIVSIPCFAK